MIDIPVGGLLVALGVALGAFRVGVETLRERVRRAVALVLVSVGVSFFAGIVSLGPSESADAIAWRSDVEAALAEARDHGKPAILDATAQWCAACQDLDRHTFHDPSVQAALRDFVAVRVDMTRFDEADDRLRRLGIRVGALPWVGFFLPDGRLNPGVTLSDYEPPSLFVRRVEAAGAFRDRPLTPVEAWLGERGLAWALVLVFLAGIGVSLTPCVYPMIPITLAVVGARNLDRAGPAPGLRDRVVRSSLFVGGLSTMYATLGVVSAAFGRGFGSWMQHPAVTAGIAALFIALAASYAGFYSMDLPSGWKARIASRRGGLAGVAIVGAAAGLVAAPCAGPVVVGILAMVGTTGDLVLGFGLMLAFALGMGMLFFVLGLSTAALGRLPRQGAWMERVEAVFAVCFLVVAIYYGKLALATG